MSSAATVGARFVGELAVPTSPEQRDFFISYNSEDKEWAEWIAWVLEENDYSTYIQEWDFRPGQNFVLMMQQASATARRTVIVLSDFYLRSLFAQPEWAAAFATDPMGRETRVLPVRVRPCQPDGILRSIIYIDVVDCDENKAEQNLLRGVRTGRAKPPSRPAFPGIIGSNPAPGEAAR